jgi:hypothetical protein
VSPQVAIGRTEPAANAFGEAMKRAIAACKAGGYGSLTLAVPAIGNLTGDVDEYLGEKAMRALERDGATRFPGLILTLATKRRSPPREPGPVVAAFATVEQLTQLFADPRTTHLFVAPWGDDEIEHLLRLAPAAERF